MTATPATATEGTRATAIAMCFSAIDPPGGPAGPLPYGPTPYGAMPMAPMGWMMVPVIQGPQAPCIETKTVTTEYVTERSHRVIRAKPHRKEKRVYTGN